MQLIKFTVGVAVRCDSAVALRRALRVYPHLALSVVDVFFLKNRYGGLLWCEGIVWEVELYRSREALCGW